MAIVIIINNDSSNNSNSSSKKNILQMEEKFKFPRFWHFTVLKEGKIS